MFFQFTRSIDVIMKPKERLWILSNLTKYIIKRVWGHLNKKMLFYPCRDSRNKKIKRSWGRLKLHRLMCEISHKTSYPHIKRNDLYGLKFKECLNSRAHNCFDPPPPPPPPPPMMTNFIAQSNWLIDEMLGHLNQCCIGGIANQLNIKSI